MKQRIHRSVTFWSGLFVMGFVCWAWRDSTKHYTDWFHRSPRGRQGWTVEVFNGAITVNHRYFHDISGALTSGTPRFTGSTGKFEREAARATEWLPRPEWTRRDYPTVEFRSAKIPYWLVLLAVALSWMGLLVWRARRRRRMVTPTP